MTSGLPNPDGPSLAFAELVALVRLLRGPDGCPWDRAQDFHSLTPYTIEECYELVDGISRGDWANLREEIGDLFYHLVFYGELARDGGHFCLDDALREVTAKMRRRHPHIFEEDQKGVMPTTARWQAMKAEEIRRKGGSGHWAEGIPAALPSLMLAQKLFHRARAAGAAPMVADLQDAAAALADPLAPDEIGDRVGTLLMAVAAFCDAQGIDGETVLREAACQLRDGTDADADSEDAVPENFVGQG